VISSGGRVSGNCIRTGNTICYVSKTFDNQQTWGVAFAFKPSVLTAASNLMVSLFDGATSQIELGMEPTGAVRVTKNNNATLVSYASSPVLFNMWNHIEWKVKIDGSVGTVDIRLNGVSILSLTGQNTKQSANAYASTVRLGSITAVPGGTWDWDDIIIYDGQINDPQGNPDIHDFIGDCGLTWLLPNGDGTTTQFSRDSGTNNYLRVNEATPDGDTSYVADATVGHLDTYAMANLPGTIATVKSIAVVNYARKDDVGTRTFAPELRTNSANFDGVTQSLGTSYAYYMSNWGQNPSGTPANWTPTDVNNLEAGQKTIA
jgi:hypothetical protein